jgi:succinoglycan biosynthesis transport protein ExoP
MAVSPDLARILSAAVRDAYVGAMADTQRETAAQNLPALTQALEVSRAKLAALEERKASMERANGLILQDNGLDLESQRLGDMARASPPPVFSSGPSRLTTAEHDLQELDGMIDSASRTLGPNNPQLLALHQRRTAAAAVVSAQRPADEAGQAVATHQKMLASRLSEQTAKVIAQSHGRTELRLLQDEINAEIQRYSKTDQRIVNAQRQAGGGGGNAIPVGPTDGPDTPVYPNNALVLAGSTLLGLIAGLLLAFITEMFGRRVRTERDLQMATGVSVVALPSVTRRRSGGFLKKLTA